MKIHFEKGDAVIDYELKPLKETHFRTLAALAAGGMCVWLVKAVVSMCGMIGLLPLAMVAVVAIGLDKM